jgi:hypothetical protein
MLLNKNIMIFENLGKRIIDFSVFMWEKNQLQILILD